MATMTLATAKASVSIILRGSGSVSISWGDGKSDSFTLSTSDSSCTHSYTNSTSRTITITGTTMTYLKCVGNQLTALSVTGNTLLENLDCNNNLLTGLSVSGLSKLTTLNCTNNNLNSLNISNCSGLKYIYCSANYLTSLNLSSGYANLIYLSCYGNNLTSLLVSNCTLLASIYCSENKLTSLSVSGLSKLTYLSCKNNQMAGTALNNLFNSLPTIPSGTSAQLLITGNPGLVGTGCCNTSLAINKRWSVDFDYQAWNAKRKTDIHDYIKNQLKFGDDAIQKVIDEEDTQSRIEGSYLVVYEDSRRDQAAKEILMECSRDVIYPGALLIVDKHLGSMSPTAVGLPRGAVKINIPEWGIASEEVKADNYGNLQGNINAAIYKMVEKYAATKTLTASYNDHTESAISMDEMALKMSCSANFLGVTAGASFDMNKTAYAMYYFTDFTQKFYTAVADYDKNDFSKLFGDTVTVDDIKKSFGNKPLVFISKVNYGRRLHLIEELQSSNQNLVQKFNVSGYGVKFDQSFSKSSSKINYKSKKVVRGGSVTTASKIFETVTTAPAKDETPAQACQREMLDLRKSVEKFKTANSYVTLKGTTESESAGVVLSYNAIRLDGLNPKDAIFWQAGAHKVKKLVPNTGIKLAVFNTSKDHNIVASGYYTKFDASGKELSTVYDIHGSVVVGSVTSGRVTLTKALRDGGPEGSTQYGRVYNKSFLTPEINLGKNIYRVYLSIRDRDGNKKVYGTYTYLLPCGNIMAGKLRAGTSGPETVNWFFGGESDGWYNGDEKK